MGKFHDFHEKGRKRVQKSVHFVKNSGKCSVGEVPDPYHGHPPGYVPPHVPTTPGTHPPLPVHPWLGVTVTAGSVAGGGRFTRLLSDTVQTSKYRLVENHHFSDSQNRPVKNDIFDQNAYLILITFTKITIFDVFADFR